MCHFDIVDRYTHNNAIVVSRDFSKRINMPTAIKVYKKLTSDYTVVANQILRHNLSLKALGLYLYIINKPNGWDFSRAGVAAQVADGESSIRTAIEELESVGFLIRERSRDENGKLGGMNWIITDTPILKPVDDFPPVDKPPVDKPPVDKTRQVNTNKVNTKKESTEYNLFESVEVLPLRGNDTSEIEKSAEELVAYFKTIFGRTGGGKKATTRNLPYWLEEYTLEEIKQAISNSFHDDWWRDKMTLELLFRKRRPTKEGESHEYIDRIAKFLASKPKEKVFFDKLTHIQVWEVANRYQIPWQSAYGKAKFLNDKIEKGELEIKTKGETPLDIFDNWIGAEIGKGKLKKYNEVEQLELADMHPDKVKERRKLDAYKKHLMEQGEL